MNTTAIPALRQNLLLATLTESEILLLGRYLEPIELATGVMLHRPGARPDYGYFPTSTVVSLQHTNEAGASAETATVGREGVVGISLFLGGGGMPITAVVQNPGQAWRVNGSVLSTLFNRRGPLASVLLRYTQTLISQMTLTLSCACHHSVEQRLSRWILIKLDTGNSPEVLTTQETIAGALGVRREAVTLALGSLQRTGLIKNGRGHLTVTDRLGLTATACTCYREMKAERNNLLCDLQRYGLQSGTGIPPLNVMTPPPAIRRLKIEPVALGQTRDLARQAGPSSP